MECAIPGPNIKEITKVLACLSKIGDDISFHATGDVIKLSTISASRSAFGICSFERSFFSRYKLLKRSKDLQIEVTAKSLYSIFSKTKTNVERCELSVVDFDQDDDGAAGSSECRLIIKFFHKHNVVKTHRLTFAPVVAMVAVVQRDQCTSHWTAHPKTLEEWLRYFWTGKASGATDEITFQTTPSACRFKSYESPDGGETGLSRAVSTLVVVDLEDFDDYQVTEDEIITLALKEFSVVVRLANDLSVSLEAAYSIGGEPLILSMFQETIKCEFIIATTNDDPAEIKKEKQPPPKIKAKAKAKQVQKLAANEYTPAASASRPAPAKSTPNGQSPLFRPPSPEDNANNEVDFDAMLEDDDFEMDDDAYAQMDEMVSQAISQKPPPRQQHTSPKPDNDWQIFD